MTGKSLASETSSTLPKRIPLSDHQYVQKREALWRLAREEGPLKCKGCGYPVRLGNRERGTCDACGAKEVG